MIDQVKAAQTTTFLASEVKVRTRDASDRILLAGLVGDTVVVFLSLLFSSWLRFDTSLATLGIQASSVRWTEYIGHAAFGAVLFVLLLPHRQFYDLHRMLRLRQIVPIILKTALMWLLAYVAFSWLLRTERQVSRIFIVVAFVTTTSFFILWRTLLSTIVSSEAIARKLRKRVLFVGWSPQARAVAQAIKADNCHPYEITGYVSASDESGGTDDSDPTIRKLDRTDRIADVLWQHDVDMVILADMNASNESTVQLANLCEKEMVEFKVIPSCFQILVSGLHLETVSKVPVLGISSLPLDSAVNVLAKQLLDFVGGVVGFILSAPIIAFFGLMVYVESPGPIIYRQRRLGRDGRPFWILKIRSMKMNAEAGGKVGWTVKDDPRRLRIGAFMRRWNIDELPQFWNVLRGEMSLVGPRPERPELIKIFKEQIPHYNARHNIRPGITGWAQVNGFRGDTDLNERVRCDIFYIENWSILLDLQIMFMTLFKRKNAC